jgi:hypothetical protein
MNFITTFAIKLYGTGKHCFLCEVGAAAEKIVEN